MSKPAKGRVASLPRRIFRACRITILLAALFLLAAAAYVNEVGLPSFVKRPLVRKLHDRGLDLEFTRLRLRWNRGIVADNVIFRRPGSDTNASPAFFVREVELKFNHSALAHFKFSVDSLILRNGRMQWPLTRSNEPPLELAATNIQTRLLFLANDQWRLENFAAEFAGAQLKLTASVTNASALRDLAIFHPGPEAGGQRILEQLRQFARIIEQIRYSAAPEVQVEVSGDARDIESFTGQVSVVAPGANTPWGDLTNSSLVLRLAVPAPSNDLSRLDLALRADSAVVHGAVTLTNLQLHATASAHDDQTNPVHAHLEASAGAIQTDWAQAATARIVADWSYSPTNPLHAHLEASANSVLTEWAQAASAHVVADWNYSQTNPIPLDGTGQVQLSQLHSRWIDSGNLDLSARMAPATGSTNPASADWAWWAALAPYKIDWNCRLREIHAEDSNVGVFELKELASTGGWLAPDLVLTNAHAELYRGRFDARAAVNIDSRLASFSAASDFDAQKISPLLPAHGQTWLGQFSWEDPPSARAAGTVILPAWTNRIQSWQPNMLPTLNLQGDVRAAAAGFRGIPVSSASLHFSYSNSIWQIPDLVAERPEGRLQLAMEDNDSTHRYHFHFLSTFDPKILHGQFPSNVQKGMDSVIFTRPPQVEADIWGQWHDLFQIGARAHLEVTNFAIRGESATRFQGDFNYTNSFIILTNGRLESGERYMTADGLGIDPEARKIFLTNGYSTMEPAPFFRVIGPKTSRIMAPYQFDEPPIVKASGTIPLTEEVEPDLHFIVDGTNFHWMRFHLGHVSGDVDWVGKWLTFTNAQGDFYEGKMTADAAFDFTVPHEGADFSFNLNVNDSDLHTLMSDLSSPTNRLEGRLNGLLKISKANTEDYGSWNGGGAVELHDGLIWAIPIFGVFTPVLDNIVPGLGESRASRGSAAFTITNSIIFSDNLEIRAPALRMEYRGTIDFSKRVDAVVEARLLRDVPLFGWLFSTALSPVTKIFQYKVTGTLAEPKTEPQFLLTRIPLKLLNPIQAIRDILPPDSPAPPPKTTPPLK